MKLFPQTVAISDNWVTGFEAHFTCSSLYQRKSRTEGATRASKIRQDDFPEI